MTFVLEDAAELFIQYFLIDKYIKAKNNFVIANGAIMSVISIAAFIGYIRIMRQHDDIELSRFYLLDALTVLFVTMTHVARTYSVIYQMSQEEIKTGTKMKYVSTVRNPWIGWAKYKGYLFESGELYNQ